MNNSTSQMQKVIDSLNIASRAQSSLEILISDGARLAVKQPWRIAKALGYSAHWPIHGLSLFDVEAMIDRKIGEETRRQHHWTYSSSRLIALKQAKRAMEILNAE